MAGGKITQQPQRQLDSNIFEAEITLPGFPGLPTWKVLVTQVLDIKMLYIRQKLRLF